MKKNLKIITLLMVLSLAIVSLTACSLPLSGTYKADASVFGTGAEKTYEFDIFGKVTVTNTVKVFGQAESVTYQGKYALGKDAQGNPTITFTFENEDADSYSGTFSFAQSRENKTITIGGVTYTKQ